MKPHFYNLRSRLGMINVPHRMKSLNLGVEDGGNAILTQEFLNNFPQSAIDIYEFPKPEDINKDQYFDFLAKTLKEAEEIVQKSIQKDEFPVVVGGDNSVSFVALTATLAQYEPSRVGYIRIDSHPDMNSISSTPSGNFHGMWMRPFVDSFEHEGIRNLVDNKIPLTQTMFIGNLDINPGEQEFFTGESIVFSPEFIRKNKKNVLSQLNEFVEKYPYIYCGIDIDAFDESIAPATGIPAKDGLLREDISETLDYIKKYLTAVDMVEVNPHKNGAEKTVELAQKILLSLLG